MNLETLSSVKRFTTFDSDRPSDAWGKKDFFMEVKQTWVQIGWDWEKLGKKTPLEKVAQCLKIT